MSKPSITCREPASAHTVTPTDEQNEAQAVCTLINQVHPSLIWVTSQIFASSRDKRVKRGGTLFLAHLLRFASVTQLSLFDNAEPSDVAKICIPNIAGICASSAKKAHSGWPWCYDTTTKYLKLLIAAGILITYNDQPGIYYLPLNECTLIPEQASQHIERLASRRAKVSKSTAFRRAAIHCTLQDFSSEKTLEDFPFSNDELFIVDFEVAQRTLQKISTIIRRSQHITLSPEVEVDLLHILKEDLPYLLKKDDGRSFTSREQGKKPYPSRESINRQQVVDPTRTDSGQQIADPRRESINRQQIVDPTRMDGGRQIADPRRESINRRQIVDPTRMDGGRQIADPRRESINRQQMVDSTRMDGGRQIADPRRESITRQQVVDPTRTGDPARESANRRHVVDSNHKSINRQNVVDSTHRVDGQHVTDPRHESTNRQRIVDPNHESANRQYTVDSVHQSTNGRHTVDSTCELASEGLTHEPSRNLPNATQNVGKPSAKSTTSESDLPRTEKVVDSAPPIDIVNNNINIISNRERIDIDSPPQSLRNPIPPSPSIRQLDVSEARRLADFVEQKPENFPNYIALSKQFSPAVIRAAVINMVIHALFPDDDGTLTGEQDGVLTNAWGRPSNAGKWVWASCRAYHKQGIPVVMDWFLTRYEGFTYWGIQRDLQALEREMTPCEFWEAVGNEMRSEGAEDEDEQSEDTSGEVPDNQLPDKPTNFPRTESRRYTPHGMSNREALQLARRIEEDGKEYQITGKVEPLPGGRYQVIAHQVINGRSVRIPHAMVSEQDWTKYIGDLRDAAAIHAMIIASSPSSRID